jgi:hypothetical protein
MTSSQIQQELIQFIQSLNFNAPYGILESQGRSQRGRPFHSITFGRPRTLDAEIQIYGSGFMTLRHSRGNRTTQVLRSLEELKTVLTTL